MMTGKERGPLARNAATCVAGLAALSGFVVLVVGATDTTVASAKTTAASASSPVTTSVSFSVDLRLQMPKQYAVAWHATGDANFANHQTEESITVPSTGLHALNTHKSGVLPGAGSLVLGFKWVNGHAYLTVPATLSAVIGGQALALPFAASDALKIDRALDQSSVALTYAKTLLTQLAGGQPQHHVGTRTINGVATSGTRVDLTLSQLLKVNPGLSPTMIGDLSKFGGEMLPVTLWIDHQGRLREVTMASTVNSTVPSISGTVLFFNYNAPVTVSAPPANEVKPLSATFLKLLSGLSPFGTFPLP
jgi:hypothetical protein